MLDRGFIKEQADLLRVSASQNEAPIDVSRIAEHANAQILYKDLEDSVSGFLLIKDGKKIIVINDTHHINRKRFTIAHELGHLILHAKDSDEDLFMDKEQVYNRNISSATGMHPQEIEANQFAATLLMPEDLLRAALVEEGNFLEDYEGVNDSLGVLAKKFSVSQQALSNRVSRLLIN